MPPVRLPLVNGPRDDEGALEGQQLARVKHAMLPKHWFNSLRLSPAFTPAPYFLLRKHESPHGNRDGWNGRPHDIA